MPSFQETRKDRKQVSRDSNAPQNGKEMIVHFLTNPGRIADKIWFDFYSCRSSNERGRGLFTQSPSPIFLLFSRLAMPVAAGLFSAAAAIAPAHATKMTNQNPGGVSNHRGAQQNAPIHVLTSENE